MGSPTELRYINLVVMHRTEDCVLCTLEAIMACVKISCAVGSRRGLTCGGEQPLSSCTERASTACNMLNSCQVKE